MVMSKVKEQEDADIVYEEFNDIGNGRYQGVLIFEKYFMRVSNRVALVVLVDNLSGKTKVTSVATGSANGILFSFDWGASNDFAYSIKMILKNHILETIDEQETY
jgi:hypothetical protein